MKKRIIIKIDTLDAIKKQRRTWKINPRTRVVPNKKEYKRSDFKRGERQED